MGNGMTWNECRRLVEERKDPVELLLVRVLDGWMDDYVHDEEWWIGLDERNSMSSDIVHYRRQFVMLMESDRRSDGRG